MLMDGPIEEQCNDEGMELDLPNCRTCQGVVSFDFGDATDYWDSMKVAYTALEEAKIKGCYVCDFLLRIINTALPGITREHLRRGFLNCDYVSDELDEDPLRRRSWDFNCGQHNLRQDQWEKCFIVSHFQLFVLPGATPTFPTFTTVGKPLAGKTSDIERLSLANTWINDCITQHDLCGPKDLRPLPTRVLWIRQEPIRLYQTHGKLAKYACLSHRWPPTDLESPPKYCLSTSNCHLYEESIDLEGLPTLFKDAIFVTKQLGLEFLWIDSLCIIQNDEEDKKREISSMAAIYSNCHVTIAANSGRNHLFTMFSTTGVGQRGFKIPVEDNTGHKGHVYMRKPVVHRIGWEKSELLPTAKWGDRRDWITDPAQAQICSEKESELFTRAWFYQERLLSARVLRFEHDELMFECNENLNCECLNSPTRDVAAESRYIKEIFIYPVRPGFGDQAAVVAWHLIVEQYTRMYMTDKSDKLPAFSAVASRFQVTRKDETYFAGLWERSFLQDLLWHRRSTIPTGPLAKQWIIPSWSWASRTFDVQYERGFMLSGSFRNPPSRFYCQVLQIHCEPDGPYHYSSVKPGGFVKLLGTLIPTTLNGSEGHRSDIDTLVTMWELRSDEIFRTPINSSCLPTGTGLHIDYYAIGDDDDADANSLYGEVFLLPVCFFPDTKEKYYSIEFLLLRRYGSTPYFERIGLYKSSEWELVEGFAIVENWTEIIII